MSNTLVFMGDSITRDWPVQALFPDDIVYNAGIGGETTTEMLARYDADVIVPRPAAVHILGGINDIAENGGPIAVDAIAANLRAMIDAAHRHHIAVVVGVLVPCSNVDWRPHLAMQPSILALNAWITTLAGERNLVVADYFAPLVDGSGGLPPAYGPDGVHPNEAGYSVMAPVARTALRQALQRT